MADRNVAKPGEDPEEKREIVELDKDERWQSRLEEARARREIALREKANQPQKKRKKPWEEDDEDDLPPIEPIIQAKPDDEPELDFADRLEVMREAPEPEPTPEPEPEVVPAPPPKKPRIKRAATPPPVPKVRDFDAGVPPAAAAPAPRPKPRRSNDLVSPDAPNVYDLAQRYAATLKPPRNVTEPFDTIYSEPTPEPEPLPEPPVYKGPPVLRRNRRPFGLGLVVLAFSLVPLTQMAPPLEKGPEPPPTPFFGLPPALGLTTSLVWRPDTFPVGPVLPAPVTPELGRAPNHETPPLTGASAARGQGPSLALPGAIPEAGALAWLGVQRPLAVVQPGALEGPSEQLRPSVLPPMQSPRPRPKSPALSAEPELQGAAVPEAAADVDTGSALDETPTPVEPAALGDTAPDARPSLEGTAPLSPQPTPVSAPLNLTILVPEGTDLARAEAIARDAEARGHSLNRIREVDVNISARNVRFFHNDDRPAATRLARSVGAEVKDFTWFRPLPEKGTTEVWLSGTPDGARIAPTVEETATVEAEPPVLVIRRKPTLLERFLTGSDAEIEIILPNPGGLVDESAAGTGGN